MVDKEEKENFFICLTGVLFSSTKLLIFICFRKKESRDFCKVQSTTTTTMMASKIIVQFSCEILIRYNPLIRFMNFMSIQLKWNINQWQVKRQSRLICSLTIWQLFSFINWIFFAFHNFKRNCTNFILWILQKNPDRVRKRKFPLRILRENCINVNIIFRVT